MAKFSHQKSDFGSIWDTNHNHVNMKKICLTSRFQMSNLHSMLMGGIVWKRKNKTMPDAVCSDDANANQVHPVNNNPVRSNDNDYKCQKCQMTKAINF